MGTHYGYRPAGNNAISLDNNFNYVSLLLNGDGTNGAQNNAFVDSSANNFTITRNGNTTQGSFSPYGNLWSNYFSSTSTDFLSLPSNTATNLSNSNFTFEAWFNKVGNPAQAGNLIWWNGNSNNSAYSGLRIQLNNDRTISLLCSETGSSWQISTSSTAVYADFSWNHVAAVRNGQTVTVYLNGVSVCSGSLSSSSASLYAGTLNYINNMAYSSGTWKMIGYVSNVRLVKGTALYTANFTPSTTPLTAITNTSLLTCQSNRLIDNSTNNFTITRNGNVRVTKESPFLPTAAYSTSMIGGSGYFDGTGDYLTAAGNSAFDFGTGDFTIEFFANMSLPSTGYVFLLNSTYATTSQGLSVRFGDGGFGYKLQVGVDVSSLSTVWSCSLTQAQASNEWLHIAFTRSSGVCRLFVNGVVQNINSGANPSTYPFTSFTDSTNLSSSTGVKIGDGVLGYMSNVRVVKGTALYTAAFTPPTAPLTAITNTSLLLNFTNAGIYDAASKSNLETVGNAQVNTSVKKYSAGSIAFDGTGDALVVPVTPALQLGAGNFTFEFWVYFNSTASVSHVINTLNSSGNDRSLAFFRNGTNFLYYMSSNGTSSWDIANGVSIGTVTTNTWYHVALVRNGSTFTPYLNGTVGTTTSSSAALFVPVNLYIGNSGDLSTAGLNGYIDDLRITKGYARYTANFTPPTGALPLSRVG